MLITSSKISSQLASTTPTAFIALLQLFGYTKENWSWKHRELLLWSIMDSTFQVEEVAGDHIQRHQHQLAPQICEALQPYAYLYHLHSSAHSLNDCYTQNLNTPFWHWSKRQYFVALAFRFAESEPNSFVQSNIDSGGPDNTKILKFQVKWKNQMMLKLEGNYQQLTMPNCWPPQQFLIRIILIFSSTKPRKPWKV